MATEKSIQELEEQVQKLEGRNACLKRTVNDLYGRIGYLTNQSAESNMESRIRTLTEELHKAQREINRLVLENQEQDFMIYKLKKQRDELFERLVTNGFHKSGIDKDRGELYKTATTIIFGSSEERHDASERAAKNAALYKQAMENTRQELAEKVDILEEIFKKLGV